MSDRAPASNSTQMNRRVLIVDSNPGALIVARNMLSRDGYEAIPCSGIDDAIGRAKRKAPHALLLDGALADQAALGRLSNALTRSVPMVVSAAKGGGGQLLEELLSDRVAPKLRLVEVVEKPFLVECVLRAVRKCFDRPPIAPLAGMESLLEPAPSKRARWLSSRIIAMLPDASRLDAASLEGACARALDEEEVFGHIAAIEGAPVMAGRLGHVTADQVLHFAESVPTTTCSRFHAGGRSIEIYLKNHDIFFARERERPTLGAGDLLLEIVRWSSGSFQIIADPSVPAEAELSGVKLPIGPLLFDVIVRLDEILDCS